MNYIIFLFVLVLLFEFIGPYFTIIVGVAAIVVCAWFYQKKIDENRRVKLEQDKENARIKREQDEENQRIIRDDMLYNRLKNEPRIFHSFSGDCVFSDLRERMGDAFKSRNRVEITSVVFDYLVGIVIEGFIITYYDALKKDYRRHVRFNAYGIADETGWLKILNEIAVARLRDEWVEMAESYRAVLLEYGVNIIQSDPNAINEGIQKNSAIFEHDVQD